MGLLLLLESDENVDDEGGDDDENEALPEGDSYFHVEYYSQKESSEIEEESSYSY